MPTYQMQNVRGDSVTVDELPEFYSYKRRGYTLISGTDADVIAALGGQAGTGALPSGGSSGGGAGEGALSVAAKIAVFADSMGEQIGGDGASLYGLLATALGVETLDGANGGWTSTEVSVLQGGLDLFVTLTGNQIPANTSSVTATVIPNSSFGAATWLTYVGSLASIPGTLTKTGDTNQWRFQRTTAGSAVIISPETRFVSAVDAPHENWVQIFRVGRNNVADTANVVRDVTAMAASLPHNRYLVLPVYNGAGYDTINTQLAAKFGPNYYDLRGWMIRNGLAAAGITPTTEDTTAVNAGNLPPSLMEDSTHLNTIGRTVEANRIADLLVAKGWFPSWTKLPVPTPTTPTLTNSVAPAITGTTTVGQVLTVSNGTWSATPDSYAYAWRRSGVAISGATSSTYTLVSVDAGQTITCTVTATKVGYNPGSATSGGVAVPANTVTVTNLATNPRAGVDTTGWAKSDGGGTSTLTQLASGGPTADAPTGVRQTFSAAPTSGPQIHNTFTIAPNAVYHVSYYVRPSWAGATLTIQVGWFNNGTFVGSTTPKTNQAAAEDVWTRIDAQVTIPNVTANQMRVFAVVGGSSTLPGIGDTWDASAVMVHTPAANNQPYVYRDGASSGWAWNGTAHASTSTGPIAA